METSFPFLDILAVILLQPVKNTILSHSWSSSAIVVMAEDSHSCGRCIFKLAFYLQKGKKSLF